MLFYSIVATVMGVLFFGVGLYNLINKNQVKKQLSAKKFKDINLYVLLTTLSMLITGVLLLGFGICSFVVDEDLAFSIIFTILIVLFFTIDFLCQKKLIIKESK